MNQININLPAIQNIAITGVRRTAVFMGFGINAANNPDFRQYELAKISSLEFIKIPAEYPPACWRDESSSLYSENKLLAK